MNKFCIGDTVYFTLGNRVYKEKIKWIREQRYIGIELKPSYCYGAETASYLNEEQLFSSLENIIVLPD